LSASAKDALGRTQEVGNCFQQQRTNIWGTRDDNRPCWLRAQEAREKLGSNTLRCRADSRFIKERKKLACA